MKLFRRALSAFVPARSPQPIRKLCKEGDARNFAVNNKCMSVDSASTGVVNDLHSVGMPHTLKSG